VVNTLRILSTSRPIMAMVGVAGLSALLVGNAFQAQMPEFADDLGDDDDGHGYTALQMSQAGGALVAGFALESTGFFKPSVPLGILCATLFALTVIAFAAAPSIGTAVALLFLTGLFRLAFSTMAQT